MFYVGIDVASQKHDCCFFDKDGSVLDQFQITNDKHGFNLLLNKLSQLDSPNNIKIGLEATGIYSHNLTVFLWRNGFETTTFNPLQTKKRLSATTLRKTKTDKADARFITDTIMREDFQPDIPVSYHTSELKSLTRLRFQRVKECSRSKIRAKAALQILFPEFINVFSDTFGVSAMAVLSKFPSAEQLVGCRLDVLERLLHNASRGRFGKEKAKELKLLAKNSIGVYSKAKTLELQCYLEDILMLKRQIACIDAEIKSVMDEIDSPILSIPGIGYTLGAMILAEIGDVCRFTSPAKLLAFAGLEPSVYQSGKYVPTSGKMVKRGSPYLRWALIQAARLVAMNSAVFSTYLDKKLSEGKHYSVASSHVAKKLVRVIFAILSKNSLYSDYYPSLAA